MNKEIAQVLRKKGSLACTEKAEVLENDISAISNLHLRNLGLLENDIIAITQILEQKKGTPTSSLKSISFSHNKSIGDIGATLIVKTLPSSVCQIGLVNCGIGDAGGIQLLDWMRTSQNLEMICMEQNNFSNSFRIELNTFKNNNPKIVVIY